MAREKEAVLKVIDHLHPESGPLFFRVSSLDRWHVVHSLRKGPWIWSVCGKLSPCKKGSQFHTHPEERICPECWAGWEKMRGGSGEE